VRGIERDFDARTIGWIFGQNLDRIGSLLAMAQNTPPKIAHATEFTLVKRHIPRPVEVIRLLAKGGLPLKIARSVLERLATTDIKGRYFHETDSVYIEIAPGPSAAVREVANGLNVDLDADDNIIGFDIDNASRLGAALRDFIACGASIDDLACAWASMDDARDEFNKEKSLGASEAAHDHYLDYLAETEEILRRAAKRARERSSVSSSPPADP
jgi:uncharacterized protein YuzE